MPPILRRFHGALIDNAGLSNRKSSQNEHDLAQSVVLHSQQHGVASRYSAMLNAGDSACVQANPIATDLPHRIEALAN
jgi:NADPH-dependent ferric siderophore reductase